MVVDGTSGVSKIYPFDVDILAGASALFHLREVRDVVFRNKMVKYSIEYFMI